MTRAMASEVVKDGIRVNAICPGYFLSEMNEDFFASDEGKEAIATQVPAGRIGAPGELDGALLLLASETAGSFITGAHIVVDGGHSCKALM